MGLTYNKQFRSKDQRTTPAGPRDRQIKQIAQINNLDQTLLIEELRSQINKLQERTEYKSDSLCYTAEQVDEEIIKAIKSETEALKVQHELEKTKLQNKIELLESTIQELKNSRGNNSDLTEEKITFLILEAAKNLNFNSDMSIKNNRPQMETVFVDPTEIDKAIENHISISEILPIEKEDMNSKVNKLKGLLGKLPNKEL